MVLLLRKRYFMPRVIHSMSFSHTADSLGLVYQWNPAFNTWVWTAVPLWTHLGQFPFPTVHGFNMYTPHPAITCQLLGPRLRSWLWTLHMFMANRTAPESHQLTPSRSEPVSTFFWTRGTQMQQLRFHSRNEHSEGCHGGGACLSPTTWVQLRRELCTSAQPMSPAQRLLQSCLSNSPLPRGGSFKTAPV